MADVAPADTDAGQISAAEDYPEFGPASYALGLLFIAYIFSFIDRHREQLVLSGGGATFLVLPAGVPQERRGIGKLAGIEIGSARGRP